MINRKRTARRVVFGLALSLLAAAPSKASARGAGYRDTAFWNAYDAVAEAVDRRVGWHRLPTWVGLLVLIGVRNRLRKRNLHDTSSLPSVDGPEPGPFGPADTTRRTVSGAYNDLEHPTMGMGGTRFGRNIPLDSVKVEPDPELLDPSPRVISRELLTRDPFQPAESVNNLACLWLQFMIKDWFSHGTGDMTNPWVIELDPDDPWHEHPMRIPRTIPDPTRPEGSEGPPTFLNAETHWWDGSQIYGTSPEQQYYVRTGEFPKPGEEPEPIDRDGKLAIASNGRPPLPDDPKQNPAMVPGWWIGLSLLRTIFTLEHNAICDRLKVEYPGWSDQALFERARLINAALLAKIHTAEWTPAVISHPTTVTALRANWFGLAGERLYKAVGRISDSEIVSGIPGSPTNHYGVPYVLTEEFTSVYRMHPLIADDYSFRRAADDSTIRNFEFPELTGPAAEEVLDEIPIDDVMYSLGTEHPGVVSLHNFPRFLQDFERPDGKRQDIGATDILRIRELGVPRYNECRRLLHLEPAGSFEELTDEPSWAADLRRVYRDDIERVDLMVGMYAERRPKGFAFSDTAFRIFVLMASRRLNSDRFFTSDFTTQVYTPAGMDWLKDNTMLTVLLRHFPDLAPAMRDLDNAFKPWRNAAAPPTG